MLDDFINLLVKVVFINWIWTL